MGSYILPNINILVCGHLICTLCFAKHELAKTCSQCKTVTDLKFEGEMTKGMRYQLMRDLGFGPHNNNNSSSNIGGRDNQ